MYGQLFLSSLFLFIASFIQSFVLTCLYTFWSEMRWDRPDHQRNTLFKYPHFVSSFLSRGVVEWTEHHFTPLSVWSFIQCTVNNAINLIPGVLRFIHENKNIIIFSWITTGHVLSCWLLSCVLLFFQIIYNDNNNGMVYFFPFLSFRLTFGINHSSLS